MELFIKQRVFTIGAKFDVYDNKGQVKYYCESEIFTFGMRLHVYDQKGKEVIYIKQKLFTFLPQYEIYICGNYVTTLVKKISFLKHNYYYDNSKYKIDGDYFAHDYVIFDDENRIVLNLTKKWLSWGDSYCMQINNDDLEWFCLASTLVIDCVCHGD